MKIRVLVQVEVKGYGLQEVASSDRDAQGLCLHVGEPHGELENRCWRQAAADLVRLASVVNRPAPQQEAG